jgi:hypothetical protein
MCAQFSLTPGFSPVVLMAEDKTVSTVYSWPWKPLKRLNAHVAYFTRLKPGVNEMGETVAQLYQSHKF